MRPFMIIFSVAFGVLLILSTVSAAPSQAFSSAPSWSDSRNTLNLTDASDHIIPIEQCGYKISSIQRLLSDVKETLEPALRDVGKGTGSTFGFQAMFKDDAAISPVLVTLQHMYTMAQVMGLQPAPSVPLSPRFACVDLDSVKKYDYLSLGFDPWEKCHTPLPSGKVEHVFYASGAAYIFLCPSFFIFTPEPVSRHCPTVRHNQFVGNQMDFHDGYQTYNLIYALARFYLGRNALDDESDPHEVFDWNDCVFKLNALESVVNPTNMELYVACESIHGDRLSQSFAVPRTDTSSLIKWRSSSAEKIQSLA